MAEDEDGVSDKKSPQNSNNAGSFQENQQNAAKPDLGIEEAKYDVKENGDAVSAEPISSSSKSTGAMRKEENPFSFRHFLKRDLSLPGNSTYENTGARPKVYANTVQHSPTKIDIHSDTRREKSRLSETQAKEKQTEGICHRNSDDTSSSSSVEIPFSVVDNSDSKHNLYADSSEGPFFHRPNLASEPLGMPSLPDFVQDHILVEQAYLNSNGPISVDLDNLPDFTFNTSYNVGSSSSLGRRNKSGYGSNRGYDYDAYMGAASNSESGPSSRSIPLDLPSGAEAAGLMPLDLPVHLSLDLTESVNPADRQHTLFHCPRFEEERENVKKEIGSEIKTEILTSIMLEASEKWESIKKIHGRDNKSKGKGRKRRKVGQRHAPRYGRPITDKIDAIFEKVEPDRHISSYNVAEGLGTGHKAVYAHLKKNWVHKKAGYLGISRDH
ncbi:jg9799 [Pararge aegeria aegeria]|uniref:Jg9799 protein n=1 Tax=Pararge aegeria aegeria TaxID=348720 RepID=A0A8S4RJP8_9NEOP|nr:jg9799 [Pararge aegeria aegeria]